ncbi:MAG: metal ABC transporter permease [Desulfovibrio sp.]|jgi:zinc transport system permease protein|nr:metal ABC transporter permease [Desulfovibrio sp.]
MDALILSLEALLASPFMRHALLAGLLAGIACGVTGVLVLQNRLTFLAGGAAHAAYGGVGLAFYFSLPVLPCTLLFSLGAAALMALLVLRGESEGQRGDAQDAAIGALWAGGTAFGIILIELSPGYSGDLMGYLFGSILTVPTADLVGMVFFDLLLLGLLFFFRQGLWALSLDKEFAAVRGLPVRRLYLLLVVFVALTVVMLIRVVGLILVLALLTIPASLARTFCRSLYPSMALAGLFSLLFCVAGLVFSWFTDISSGASIIVVAVAVYLLARVMAPAR